MATTLTPDAHTDIVTNTLHLFDKKRYVNISFDLNNYAVMKKIFDPHKVKKDGGDELSWRVKVDSHGNFKMSSMYGVSKVKAKTVFTEAKLGWKKAEGAWLYDIDEDEFQSSKETIVRLVTEREADAMQEKVEGLETQAWSSPASTTSNVMNGIPYHLVKPTAGQEGFSGGAPSGHTTVCNINPSTYTNWKSYVFDYTDLTFDDLGTKLRKANWETKFMAPAPFPDLGANGDSQYGHYTTYAVWAKYKIICEARNENLGWDLAGRSPMGDPLFGGNPVCAVGYLTDNDSENPWYGINWAVMEPYVKKNGYMRRSPQFTPSDQPTVRVHYIHTWLNIRCKDRRRAGFCGAQV